MDVLPLFFFQQKEEPFSEYVSVVEVEKVAHDNANETVRVTRAFDVGGHINIDGAHRDGADAKALTRGLEQEFNLGFKAAGVQMDVL